MSRYDGLIIPRSYSEYLNKTDSATLSQMLQHLTGLWSHAVSAGDNKPVTSDAVNNALNNYQKIQTYTITNNGGAVSINLRKIPCLYFVCWGYDTFENSMFIQYNYDWRGSRVKVIPLKIESAWVSQPKVEIVGDNLIITHQHGDGTCMQVCGLC